MSQNLLVKTTAASCFTANQLFSRKGSLRVYLLECAASQWRIQRNKSRMKVLVVLMTTDTAINGFVFSMTKIRILRAVI